MSTVRHTPIFRNGEEHTVPSLLRHDLGGGWSKHVASAFRRYPKEPTTNAKRSVWVSLYRPNLDPTVSYPTDQLSKPKAPFT
jgi:hypothetical protein